MELCAFKRNNFILYKLIPCLIIIMFAFMCLYGSKVYASYDFQGSNDIVYILPDEFSNYDYIFITDIDQGQRSLGIYASNTKPLVFFDSNNERCIGFAQSNTFYISVNTFRNHSLDYSSSEVYHNTTSTDFYDVKSLVYDHIAATNFDVYDIDNNLVFQAPPQQVEATTILTPIVQEQEMKPLAEILGILPVVIVVLVGLIAIRKGIQFLMARMKKA